MGLDDLNLATRHVDQSRGSTALDWSGGSMPGGFQELCGIDLPPELARWNSRTGRRAERLRHSSPGNGSLSRVARLPTGLMLDHDLGRHGMNPPGKAVPGRTLLHIGERPRQRTQPVHPA
ncbi:hypothetical protein WQQ_32680 [Hydrocarboniphaga effusa AP103]|uniref:Uncharacterized protein n=1 Tax=Hydrocarboniphaga effusa AP103 TaxID=1172194 RepID=I8I1Q1_9GAMM|nr:hypothetical protein WQQ_32680 [Hydrocarboniphaga effusa AP103]